MITNLAKKVLSITATTAALVAPLLVLATPVAATGTGDSAKLELTNVVDKALADRGETLSYTLTVKNTGSIDTTNTYLWINQPNLADYVAGSSNYQGFPGGNLMTLTDSWIKDGVNFGKVPAGKYIVLKYQTKVAQNANTDDIIWSAAGVKSDQTQTVQANSYTKVILKNPSLCGAKTADKTSVSPGDVVTFTIKACNNGNVVLNNVYIGDTLHPPFQYIPGTTTLSVSGEKTIQITDNWINDNVNIGPLNPGQEAFLKFQVKVTDSVTDGVTYQNVAQLKSDETPNILQCTVVLKGKVLGIVEQPKPQLPNTGPGDALVLTGLLAPVGYLIKRFKTKI